MSFTKNAGSLPLPTSQTFLADYPRQRNRGENRAHLPRRDNYFEQPSLSFSLALNTDEANRPFYALHSSAIAVERINLPCPKTHYLT